MTEPLELNEITSKGGEVIGVGKIEDIFVKEGITKAVHTGSNREGLELTLKFIKDKAFTKPQFIFTNLVDTDMLYGHRNNYKGYAKAIEEIDTYLPKITEAMTDEDLLIITADHGCDPTVPGTDHTREQVPIIIYSKGIKAGRLPEINTFSYISDRILNWFNI